MKKRYWRPDWSWRIVEATEHNRSDALCADDPERGLAQRDYAVPRIEQLRPHEHRASSLAQARGVADERTMPGWRRILDAAVNGSHVFAGLSQRHRRPGSSRVNDSEEHSAMRHVRRRPARMDRGGQGGTSAAASALVDANAEGMIKRVVV